MTMPSVPRVQVEPISPSGVLVGGAVSLGTGVGLGTGVSVGVSVRVGVAVAAIGPVAVQAVASSRNNASAWCGVGDDVFKRDASIPG
jgi:hypothetical protein